MDSILFLKATFEDLDQMVTIHNENVVHNINNPESGFLLYEINRNSIEKKIHEGSEYQFFVAKENEQVYGFLQVHSGISVEEIEEFRELHYHEDISGFLAARDFHTHILTIAVRQAMKNQGIGKFLYQRLFDAFPGHFFTAFIVVSPLHNSVSIEFHEKFGFKEVAVFKGGDHYKIRNYESRFFLKER